MPHDPDALPPSPWSAPGPQPDPSRAAGLEGGALVLAAESVPLGPDPTSHSEEERLADEDSEAQASAASGPDGRAVAGLMAVMSLSAVDVMIVGTAMPHIIGSLGGLALYPWVFTAFILASTLALPFAGRWADAVGMRPALFAAIAVFLLGSGACAAAWSMPALIGGRFLQGLGAGALTALIFTAFGALYPPERRGKAQAIISGVWGVASLAGPPLGGFLVTQVPWPVIFLLNLPVGLLATWLLVRHYPNHPPTGGAFRFDPWGAGLLSGGLLLTVMGLEGAAWTQGLGLPLVGGGLALLGAFFWWQGQSPDPIAPTRLFRRRAYAAAALGGLLPFATVFAVNNFMPLYLQGALGLRPDLAGAVMLPASVAWPLAAAIAGMLVNRLGFRNLCALGAGLLLLGATLLATLRLDAPVWHPPLFATVLCFGMGLLAATTMIMGQSSVPRSAIGAASGTLLLTRNLAVTVGVGGLGALQVHGFGQALAQVGIPSERAEELVRQFGGLPPEAKDALARSIGPVFLATALGAALTLLLVLSVVPPWTPMDAARAAQEEA